mgnify:CR=1 FL=1
MCEYGEVGLGWVIGGGVIEIGGVGGGRYVVEVWGEGEGGGGDEWVIEGDGEGVVVGGGGVE